MSSGANNCWNSDEADLANCRIKVLAFGRRRTGIGRLFQLINGS
jgi:hypothetical protein